MTSRDRFLLTLMIPVLVSGGVWFLLLGPKRKEVERLDTSIAAAQTRLATAQSNVASYEAARREVAANLKVLGNAGKAVPASVAMPALLRQLERTGRRTGVDMQSVVTADAGKNAAATPTAGAQATPLNVTLTFDGRFFALQRFLGRLDRFIRISREQVQATGRLLSVRDLTLASKDGHLSGQVQASVYVLPDLQSILPPAATPATPAPGNQSTSAGQGSSIATPAVAP
jgi:Tfp pilus assembly protein PilO